MSKHHRTILCILAATVVLAALPAVSQAEPLQELVRVERTISTAHALPDSVFRVTLRIELLADLEGVGVREVLPFGWTVHPVESAGAAFKRSENEWVFMDALSEGASVVLVYEVTVPPADRLYGETLPECFQINGIFQSTIPAFDIPIAGDTEVEVSSTLPILSAIAHLIVGTGGASDRIDLRSDQRINERQIARAIEYWSTDMAVPLTAGEIINLPMLERLDAYYDVCMPVDEPLPLSIDPDFIAFRSIETFLPCDSVLLPKGCLDPGLEGRQFSARVEISGSQDAYGVGLAENLPRTWRVTPVAHPGFAFRPSMNEWFYSGRLAAGQTISVDYLVEVVASAADQLRLPSSCCGDNSDYNGLVSTGLQCSERPVAGEDSVYIWDCLPVILAISRWDPVADRLDVRLANTISYAQVERAFAFWQSGTAVPHTCGYTVGWHMLKRIEAYWSSGLPITMLLPTDAPMPCENEGGCYAESCPQGSLCYLTELQRVEDFVGVPITDRDGCW